MLAFSRKGLKALQKVNKSGLQILCSISVELFEFINKGVETIIIQKTDCLDISKSNFYNGINYLVDAEFFMSDFKSKNRYFINADFFEKEKV